MTDIDEASRRADGFEEGDIVLDTAGEAFVVEEAGEFSIGRSGYEYTRVSIRPVDGERAASPLPSQFPFTVVARNGEPSAIFID